VPRVRGVHPVAVRFERGPCGAERPGGPAQVARDERDLGLGEDTPRAGDGLFRTERTRRPSQEGLRSNEITELRHRDASQRERRRGRPPAGPPHPPPGGTRPAAPRPPPAATHPPPPAP